MLIRLLMYIVFFLIFNHFFIGIEIHKTFIIALVSYLLPKLIEHTYYKIKHSINRGRE